MNCRVHLRPSGHEFEVVAGESILEAALRQGVTLPYGCQSGACRSCRARLIEGAVHYPGGPPAALEASDEANGFVLLCAAHPAAGPLALEVEELSPDLGIKVHTFPARVAVKRQLAHDVIGLTLQLPAAQRLRFLAGQYVDVLLRDGRRRAFSLASAPQQDQRLEFQIRRVPGGAFSEYVFSHLKERALLRLRGPLGSFYLRKQRGLPVILVAGGTGFAPIKSLVEDALAEGFDQAMHIYWGVRARRDLYLDDLAREWAARHPRVSYTPVLSEPRPEDQWTGRTGFVHEAVLADFPDLAGYVVYMSGPPAMVAAGRESFTAHNLRPADIHADAFELAHQTGHDG